MLTYNDVVEMRRVHMAIAEQVTKAREILKKANDRQKAGMERWLKYVDATLYNTMTTIDELMTMAIEAVDKVAEDEP